MTPMPSREDAARSIVAGLMNKLDGDTLRLVEAACHAGLRDFEIRPAQRENTELTTDFSPDRRAYQMFYVAKKIEGLSDKSLQVYKYTLDKFLGIYPKPLAAITANDIRMFMASRQGATATTRDNERRHLSSFFGWLLAEEYIPKNPMLKIKKVKQARVVRPPFSGREIEELRDACVDNRERAIIEIMLSTGMRVGELHGVDRKDVSGSEIIVTGKGNKQRVCYLNPAALKRLNDYLEERSDHYPPLIANQTKPKPVNPENRMAIGMMEKTVRMLGRRAGVKDTHPHRFRRTAATLALQRGMPIEQVKIMLGHESIETTLRYAITADDTVKHSHAKYM